MLWLDNSTNDTRADKMKFKIVENHNDLWSKQDQFIELYNTGVTTKKIKNDLELNSRAYCRLLKECAENGSITLRGSPNNLIHKYMIRLLFLNL